MAVPSARKSMPLLVVELGITWLVLMPPVRNAHEASIHALSDEALRAKTAELRARLGQGTKLDELLPDAWFASHPSARRKRAA